MKKAFLEQLNKIKSHFDKDKDITKKEKKLNTDFLIEEFRDLSKYSLSPQDLSSLDYYYRTYPKPNENPIIFVSVVAFHHKKGSIVEFFHPSKEEILKVHNEFFVSLTHGKNISIDSAFEDILNQITYFCLPDAVHTTNEDSQFFLIQNYNSLLYGVSCYKQIKTNSNEIDDQNTRACVQKAICLITKLPLFGQFYSKLSSTMSAFFNQNTLKDKQILEQLFANYDSISFNHLNINEVYMSFSVRKLFMFCKEKLFSLLKILMLEKKVIVYSHVSNSVCSFIFSLVSLFPGNSIFNLNFGQSIKTFLKSINMLGLPLKIFNSNCKLFPLFTLYELTSLEKLSAFLVGTTNKIVLNNSKIKYDVVINLDTGKIIFNEGTLPEKIIKSTKYEKSLFNLIYNKIKDSFKDENENWMVNMNMCELDFEGSDDYIRNEIKNYFYTFLINFSLAYQTITNHVMNNKKLSFEIVANNDKNNNNSEDEKDSEDSTNNGTNTNSNSNEKELKKIIEANYKILKKTLKNILEKAPNIEFLCAWTDTLNFKFWFNQVDKYLYLRSEYVKQTENITIYYENGDIFQGILSFGQKNGFGVLTESNGFVYNGNWTRDMKDGYGTLSSNDSRFIYDGEWKENKKHGHGQLINDKTKYSGSFRNDVYHGSGILCDENGNIYDGEFTNGLFEGMGHFKSKDGDSYVGQMKKNKYHGKGQLTCSDGSIYSGDFIEGKKCGEGLMLYPDGSKYEGLFSNDNFHGEGTLTKEDSTIIKGEWKNGEISEKK